MKLVNRAFESAKLDIDLDWKEIPGKESNPRITAVYAAVDGLGNPEMLDDSKTAWCSCYANFKIQQQGGRGTRSAAARSWLRWGYECEPHKGCIVILKRGNSVWEGHVGFLWDFNDKYVMILGGNQGNDVNVIKFHRSDVLGFRTSKD